MSRTNATAQQLRDRRIFIDIPDSELRLECRRPDPLDQATYDLLPLELFGEVMEKANKSSAGAMDFAKGVIEDPQLYGDFIDRWVCAAVVTPSVVLTRAEAEANSDAIWVEDLEPGIRLDVWARTNDRLSSRRVSDALKSFRDRQPVRPGGGSDGAAVSRVALTGAADPS